MYHCEVEIQEHYFGAIFQRNSCISFTYEKQVLVFFIKLTLKDALLFSSL